MKPFITSTDWKGDKCALADRDTKLLIREGQKVVDFRGDPVIVTGGRAPHKPGSTGFIFTAHREFYASVVNAEWVKMPEGD